MTQAAIDARERLYQDLVSGRPLDPTRVVAAAQLVGVTVAAFLVDLFAEAGVA